MIPAHIGHPKPHWMATDSLNLTLKLLVYFFGECRGPNYFSLPKNLVSQSILTDLDIAYLVEDRNFVFFYHDVKLVRICGILFDKAIAFPDEFMTFEDYKLKRICDNIAAIACGLQPGLSENCSSILTVRTGVGYNTRADIDSIKLLFTMAGMSCNLIKSEDAVQFLVVR